MAEAILQVTIITPQQTLFKGLARSVSSTNSSGKFDILPKHANFITLIKNQPINIRLANNQLKKYNFPLAIIYTVNDQIKIFTNINLQLNTN